MKLSLIIPAYNEELRIARTLKAYHAFFADQLYEYEILVVLNGCKDNTLQVVQDIARTHEHIKIIELDAAGKGLAVRAGFAHALKNDADVIGFVDADMATEPVYFNELVNAMPGYDGVIASRYMPGATVEPPRPLIKRWGSWLFYDSLTQLLFGLSYYDTQCGAKVFARYVIATIIDELSVEQWAFDVDLLYACKRHAFDIAEVPITWRDQAGSKLSVFSGGMRMLWALIKLRLIHLR